MRRAEAACALLAACGAPAAAPADDLEGVPVAVHVLDARWVRCDGIRMPLDGFVVMIRQRVRAAQSLAERPLVQITGEPGTTAILGALMEDLSLAGVRRVSLGSPDR